VKSKIEQKQQKGICFLSTKDLLFSCILKKKTSFYFLLRQKPQAQTPQAPIRNRKTRKVANAKGLSRNTNLP